MKDVEEAVFEGSILKRAFGALARKTSNVKLVIEDGTLRAAAVDSGNVSYVEVAAAAISATGSVTAYVDVDSLLAQIGSGEVTLEFGERIVLRQGRTKYEIPYVLPEHVRRTPRIGDLPLTAKAEVEGEEFKRYVKLLKKIDDEATFSSDGSEMKIEASSSTERLVISLDAEGSEARSTFSTHLLEEIASTLKPRDLLSIEIGTNVPGIFRVSGEDLTMLHVIAPRFSE